MYSYDFINKFKMLYWYSLQFILNPYYFNSALLDNFDGFLASELLTVEEDVASNDGSIKPFTVQYRLQNRAKLESYFQDHAAAMREDGMKRFGGKFTATRRILAVSQKFSS